MLTITGASSRSGELAGPLATVMLIQQCGNRFGWSAPWVDLLVTMRTDATTDVRVGAAAVWMAAE
ncbi:hypothetical protein ACW2Q0_13730 [Nocardia sp. R16R-3T]